MNFNDVYFEMAAGLPEQLPESDLPEIVFSGHSNVGKSSLINRLVQRKSLARVSAQPGKTATINFYRLKQLRLVDLPGYGYAKISKTEKLRWARLVEGYFAQNRRRALIIQILDLRHPPTDDDADMLDFLSSCGCRFAVVLTKADKLNKTQLKEQLEYYKETLKDSDAADIIAFSARTGSGETEIRELIEYAVNNFSETEV